MAPPRSDAATAAPDAAASARDAAVSSPDAAGPIVGTAGCSDAGGNLAYAPGTTFDELVHAGTPRTFRVHVPPGADAAVPLPLVLLFHGGGGSGLQFEERSADMDPIADREGFIAVYPDGSGVLRTWNGGGCCGYAVQNDVDDVGFVAALLDRLEAALCIDRRRVFASGMSNGGIFSHRLACELAERVAAIAPVAGTDGTSACSPLRPVPVLQIHGTADGHVPWEGGVGCGPAGVAFTSVPATIERWRARNECDSRTVPYLDQGDGQCTLHTGCSDGADVVLCSIEGGGHNWPGGQPPAGLIECPGNGFQSETFVASEVVWQFFAAHPMRER